ncbi:hypothetical protein [Tsukamurella hominis]|uniref:hypothetical protein n=1 Tax=Tsukamurella hominis TaxID=1970232 RepID=UPI0039ECC88F
MDYSELIADGGVFTRRRAIDLGVEPAELARWLRVGTVEALRPGWYAVASRDHLVARAVKAGGVLSCVSALSRFDGVWVPPGDGIHVRRSEHQHRKRRAAAKPVQSAMPAAAVTRAQQSQQKLRADRTTRVTPRAGGCAAYGSLSDPRRAVDGLREALACAARCVSDEYLVAILDSVLHHKLLEREDLVEVFHLAPRRITRLLDELDENAGSGTESLVRFRLRALGMRVRTQVYFDEVGWVDLVVGDRMIIECDSKSHHLGAQYQVDRTRDLVSLTGGRVTVRLSYESVLFDWDTVEKQLRVLFRRRLHLTRKPVQKSPPKSA